MIILFFGQPASGKTTLADAFVKLADNLYCENIMKLGYSAWDSVGGGSRSFECIRIDGDRWRDITKNKDYSKEGRLRNLKGAFDMALYMENEGYTPVVSFVTPYEELRTYLRENSKNLVEIYLTYNGDRGRSMNFAKDFEEPTGNYLKIDTTSRDEFNTIDECVDKVNEYIKNQT